MSLFVIVLGPSLGSDHMGTNSSESYRPATHILTVPAPHIMYSVEVKFVLSIDTYPQVDNLKGRYLMVTSFESLEDVTMMGPL